MGSSFTKGQLNYLRYGYDYKGRWEDGLANIYCKRTMD